MTVKVGKNDRLHSLAVYLYSLHHLSEPFRQMSERLAVVEYVMSYVLE